MSAKSAVIANDTKGRSDRVFLASQLLFEIDVGQGGNQISLPDLFGGLYIGSYEKFLLYVKDWDQLGLVMNEECGINDPIWFYWCEMYEIFKKQDSHPLRSDLIFVRYDDDTNRLLERAAVTSTRADAQGTKLVRLEHILLATFDFEAIAPLSQIGCVRSPKIELDDKL